MERYQNTSGQSGIEAFELGVGWIKIRFADGWLYTFTEDKVGRAPLIALQQFAVDGQGLNTYINQYVRDQYTTKEQSNEPGGAGPENTSA